LIKKLFKPSYTKRFLFFVFSDIIIFFISIALSFSIRFNIVAFAERILQYRMILATVIISKLFSLYFFRIYSVTWKYFSIKDVIKTGIAVTIAQIFSYAVLLLMFNSKLIDLLSRSVIIMDYMFSIFIAITFRMSKRMYVSYFQRPRGAEVPILIYGAGDAGEQIIREMLKGSSIYDPKALIDDNPSKRKQTIHNIPVEGALKDIPSLMKKYEAKTILIAIPSIEKKRLNEIFKFLNANHIKDIKILPPVSEIIEGKLTVNSVKDLDIVDLIGRESVAIDKTLIGEYLKGQTVLVTGAGGSIGGEIVKQVIQYDIKELIALDIAETELFNLHFAVKEETGKEIIQYLADVREPEVIKKLFSKYAIDVVFHAAALKHVPMCELFPEEAVKTNIGGTLNLVKSSDGKVKRFIFISTDKAVNPSSIMGGTKRICEYIINSYAKDSSTKFTSVRFGNVLGSRGSVIPIFEKQIKEKRDITITDERMKRYFMTIPEAVQLVVEAGGAAEGGEIFILDMGEPVLIKDIAENMIRMFGYEPGVDIFIKYTGARKGEKLFEELLRAEEGVLPTKFDKIMKAVSAKIMGAADLQEMIDGFREAKGYDEVKKHLKKNIVQFRDV